MSWRPGSGTEAPRIGRRHPAATAVLAGLFLCVGDAAAEGAAGGDPTKVAAVERIVVPVADAAVSTAFYRDILGFSVVDDGPVTGPELWPGLASVAGLSAHVVSLRLGAESLDLVDWGEASGSPLPADSRAGDLWSARIAIVVRDMKAAHEKLLAAGARTVSAAPQTFPPSNPDLGGVEAFRFRDPDGHLVDLVRFPPGRGGARWQEPGDDLFQGIDHVAMAVSSVEASVGFYTERLGFGVTGRSEVYGPEQEALSGEPGSHVRVTMLRAASGPGIALAQHLSPAGGRPRPLDAKPVDRLAWLVVVAPRGEAPARLVPDPDRHWLRFRPVLPGNP